MIKVKSLNKFYNKHRQNEIHAILDTTLTFPEKGLVALTGPSGCGKTTLLNVIGGLDKFDSGTIDFNGHLINSYKHQEWDALRNAHVGYIFQNYYLIEDKTVFENIEVALNMAGLYQHDLVEERVHYVLKSVGMYNYRHRNVMALSGGQQQRVAIARAIAKNPGVVLADEPTGNLDVNNTFEIMNIIKKISETRLVILVSHERDLVDFYADRVIEILDGKVVKDYENVGNRTLEHVDERNIYLQDLSMDQSEGIAEIKYYYDHPGLVPSVKLIHLNDTLYVKVEGNAKIKYLTDDAEIRLLDAHYKKPETEDMSQYLFDLNQFGEIKREEKRKSFVRWRDTLKNGFKKFINSRKLVGRFFLFVCFVVACLLAFNLARVSALLQDKNFMDVGRNFVQIEIGEDMDYDEMQDLIGTTALDSIIFGQGISKFTFLYENFYQGSGDGAATLVFDIYSYDQSMMPVPVTDGQADTSHLIDGRLPLTTDEVAIDVWLADKLLGDQAFMNMGITEYADLADVQIVSDRGLWNLNIVGIIETNSPVMVLTEANKYYFRISNLAAAAGSVEGKYVLTEGRAPENANEIAVRDTQGSSIGAVVMLNEGAEDATFTVVGIYETEMLFSTVITNAAFEKMMVNQWLYSGWLTNMYGEIYMGAEMAQIYFYSENPGEAVSQLEGLGYTAADSYLFRQNQNIQTIFQQLIFVLIGLVVVLVYVIFMMRSSMLSRIKEIGIYRSIGATKGDMYKIFFSEIFAFTCLGSVTGYLFMTYVMDYVQKKISGGGVLFGAMSEIFYFPLPVFLAGLGGIFLVNIFFGMLPIFTLLRKTPSEINTKYDI